ncbi:MAG: energy-coupling factor transporter ATPase [Clostridia bacterium]|nr:energy-coupling factor transporter ATPase [Clostridia bacterium]
MSNIKTEIIKTENISFSYNPEENSALVLDGIDLEIEQNSFVAILGHNGSGKSTLAKNFNGILLPTGGKVYACGIDTAQSDKILEIRRNMGMVFQNPDNQIIATVVDEDIAFALENLGVPHDEMVQRVDEALEIVGMTEYKHHAPHRLSGGQKQRVAIAGIIAMRPKCLIMDEPTAMLDPKGRKEVMATIKRLKSEQGVTVVLITHYMDEAVQADRVIVMDDGKILVDGTPEYVFQNVGLLHSVALDVPQAAELMYKLREYDIKVPISVLNEKDCVEVLSKLLEGKIDNNHREFNL